MAIIDRLEDARHLAAGGRWEGALTMILLAVAAASRAQFPKGTPSAVDPKKPMADREAFLAYLRDNSMKVTGPKVSSAFAKHTGVAGKDMSTDEILYEFYRCSLVHEGSLHPVVALRFEQSVPGVTKITVGGDPSTGKFTVKTGVLDWLHHIVRCDLQRRGLWPDSLSGHRGGGSD